MINAVYYMLCCSFKIEYEYHNVDDTSLSSLIVFIICVNMNVLLLNYSVTIFQICHRYKKNIITAVGSLQQAIDIALLFYISERILIWSVLSFNKN